MNDAWSAQYTQMAADLATAQQRNAVLGAALLEAKEHMLALISKGDRIVDELRQTQSETCQQRIAALEAEVETRGQAVSTLDEYNRRLVAASRETLHQKVTLEQAATEAHLQAQRRIEALEAEVARAATCAQCQGINEGLIKSKHATEIEADSREQALLKQIDVFRETNHHLEQRIEALEADVAQLRRLCTHTPPGSDPACVLCQVRVVMENGMQPGPTRNFFMQYFDGAMQVVREGQG